MIQGYRGVNVDTRDNEESLGEILVLVLVLVVRLGIGM